MSVVCPPVGGVTRIVFSTSEQAMPSRSVITADVSMGEWPEGLLREDGEAVIIAVAVQPAAKRVGIEGIDVWRARLQVAVKALPQKGAANEAVCELLAEALEVPLIFVDIVAGQKARQKSVRFRDVDIATLESRLEVIVAAL